MMDVLVEMTPGAGWLARENDRLIFLPNDESVDVAHAVIEPLLTSRDMRAGFATMGEWIHSGQHLPPMVLVSLESSIRLMSYELQEVQITETHAAEPHRIALGTTTEVMTVGQVSTLVFNDDREEASGMLVEGVVRAGGLRMHFHRGWSAAHERNTDVDLPASDVHLELDGQTVMIGNGLVLGRWPYSHPDLDRALEPLILSDPAVSRLHATIRPSAEGPLLIDNSSHNGSWVIKPNGDAVRVSPDAPRTLAPGDHVRVGDTTLRVL